MTEDIRTRLYNARMACYAAARQVVGDGDYISNRYGAAVAQEAVVIKYAREAGWTTEQILSVHNEAREGASGSWKKKR